MSGIYDDSVETKEALFMASLIKEKLKEFVKSDSFISKAKLEIAFQETLSDFEKKGKTVTEEQEAKLRDSMYSNQETAFLREIYKCFDEYKHEFEKSGKSYTFNKLVSRIYDKYCTEPTNKKAKDLDRISKKVEKNAKKQNFLDMINTICAECNSKGIILSRINSLAEQYGSDDFCEYIDKAGKIFGMTDTEIVAMKRYVSGNRSESFIFTRYGSHAHRFIVSMYQTYKSDYDNELIHKDENGIIKLDDFKYVNSKRKSRNMNMDGSWIIGSNLDAFYSTTPADSITQKERLAKILLRAKSVSAIESMDFETGREVKKNTVDSGYLQELEVIVKSLAKTIQTPIVVGSNNIEKIDTEDLKDFNKILKNMINDPDMSDEKKEAVLRKIDEKTPTTTSDEMIDRFIEMSNDPNVDITPSQILSVLISESEEEIADKMQNRQEKIDYLVSSLVGKICDGLNIQDDSERLNIYTKFNSVIQSQEDNIKEKNSFLMPQMAAQLGIDAVVYYKASDLYRSSVSGQEDIVNILEVLKKYNLIDDTTQYLTKNLLKPDETLILAKEFMPETKNNKVRMRTINEAISNYVKTSYAKRYDELKKELEAAKSEQLSLIASDDKNNKELLDASIKKVADIEMLMGDFSKKSADSTVKGIRQGVIKQSLFNKLINFTNESNDVWGLIKDEDGRLRLAPKFVYEESTPSIQGNNVRRVVQENRDSLMDFIIEYSKEDWFREWVDNAVVNLDFDKACSDMTRLTGVTLNDSERTYYKEEIFDNMHSFIVNANEVNYNPDLIKEEWKSRTTPLQKAKRGIQIAQSKVLVKKRNISEKVKTIRKKKDGIDR